MDSKKKRTLESMMFYWGNEQKGLEKWARLCVEGISPRVREYAPVGYCSWYQYWAKITGEQMEEAVESFAKWPSTRGGKVMQLDDGFQRCPGDWRPNPRFEKVWAELPEKIEKAGGIPGLWIAPCSMYPEHPFVKNRPELLQHLRS